MGNTFWNTGTTFWTITKAEFAAERMLNGIGGDKRKIVLLVINDSCYDLTFDSLHIVMKRGEQADLHEYPA